MMNKEIKEILDLLSIESMEEMLTDMKIEGFIPYEQLTQFDIEHYLDLRKGALFWNKNHEWWIMLPNEVKPYTESYQYIWKHRTNYQEFRFNVMNMWVPD